MSKHAKGFLGQKRAAMRVYKGMKYSLSRKAKSADSSGRSPKPRWRRMRSLLGTTSIRCPNRPPARNASGGTADTHPRYPVCLNLSLGTAVHPHFPLPPALTSPWSRLPIGTTTRVTTCTNINSCPPTLLVPNRQQHSNSSARRSPRTSPTASSSSASSDPRALHALNQQEQGAVAP